MTNSDSQYYSILPEVYQALTAREPIVALESTVITHGLPYPENLHLATEVEDIIRQQGCIPATIAIVQGRICIGLERNEVEQLVNTEGLIKVSLRDIAQAVQAKKSGGTTVAGTLAIAHEVGIKVFATGGIGGVHRNAPFDVSADLIQLTRSKLVVVCAGAKAILDIPATVEVLETIGVPVVGYKTDEFPVFYSSRSGIPVPIRADTPENVSNIAKTHWNLGFQGSILVVVPPPNEVAVEGEVIESALRIALTEVQEKRIHGQAVTPYLLNRLSQLTDGKSLQANLGLLRNNALIAAEFAHYLS